MSSSDGSVYEIESGKSCDVKEEAEALKKVIEKGLEKMVEKTPITKRLGEQALKMIEEGLSGLAKMVDDQKITTEQVREMGVTFEALVEKMALKEVAKEEKWALEAMAKKAKASGCECEVHRCEFCHREFKKKEVVKVSK